MAAEEVVLHRDGRRRVMEEAGAEDAGDAAVLPRRRRLLRLQQ